MNSSSAINLFSDFTWQFNFALAGGAFAVFSLIHNDYYIYYGFITFAFGILGHIVYKFWEWVFRKSGTENKYYWLAHLSNAILAIAWIKVILYIY